MRSKDVRQYRFLERVIRVQEHKIDKLRERTALSDKVYGSNPEYPYEPRSFTVIGDVTSLSDYAELEGSERELQRLITLKAEIEAISDDLQDAFDKLVWDMSMEGKSQEQIARAAKTDQGTISRRLSRICERYTR